MRAKLLSLVISPKCCYKSLFIAHDRMLYETDRKVVCWRQLLRALNHHIMSQTPQTLSTAEALGSIKYVRPIAPATPPCCSLLQSAICSPHSTLRELASYPVSQSTAPARDYVALLKQLGPMSPSRCSNVLSGWTRPV